MAKKRVPVKGIKKTCEACEIVFYVYPSASAQKYCSMKCRPGGRTVHSGCKTRIYSIFRSMKSRCQSPGNTHFQHYGGRGIVVCDEWSTSFVAFRDWSFLNGYKEGLVIDRIDTNSGYCPSNCRWVTPSDNKKNIRKKSSAKSSQYKGVWWSTQAKRFQSAIRVNNKRVHLGSFKREIDAAIAYDAAARKYYGEFSHCNFRLEELN